MTRELEPRLPYGLPPEHGGPTAYQAGIALSAVGTEMKSAVIAAATFGEYQAAADINASVRSLMTPEAVERVDGQLSQSAFPETVKQLSGMPFAVFRQEPGAGKGHLRQPHLYELTPRGEDEHQPFALQLAMWSLRHKARYNKYLGEPHLPTSRQRVPSVILKMNALTYAVFSQSFVAPELAEWTNSFGPAVRSDSYEATLGHFVGEEVLASSKTPGGLKYQLRDEVAETVTDLLDIYMRGIEGDQDFFIEGHELLAEVRDTPGLLDPLVIRAAELSERTKNKRLSYPALGADAATLLAALPNDTLLGFDEIVERLGIGPLNHDRIIKLRKQLLQTAGVRVMQPEPRVKPLYGKAPSTASTSQ